MKRAGEGPVPSIRGDLHPARISALLRSKHFGRCIVLFERIASTNTAAAAAAEAGFPEGSLFLAEEQTAGRGREGRCWSSIAGKSLVFSIILRPGSACEGLTMLFALGALEALGIYKTGCMIKWPNDLYLGGKKAAGILAERRGEHVVMGLGLNVNETPLELEGIDRAATSLMIETGTMQDRGAVLARTLENFERLYGRWRRDGLAVFVEAIEERLLYRGEEVIVNGGRGTVRGSFRGITDEGYLRLAVGNEERICTAGDLSLRGENG
ncbi:MAG: biotin--[acetyl-CoA-carboxylase] ligase [bacterium]|nr:MAG: biotin--[acetyl-CoA-carboxylase] ligase [bacterium]